MSLTSIKRGVKVVLIKNKTLMRAISTDGYKALVKRVQAEIDDLEFFIKRRTAEAYWKVGKFIHQHLLENKERADYGKQLLESLSEDVDRDPTTLSRALQFYRLYPILVPGQELSWGHYRRLITIKDKGERNKLEKKILEKQWDTRKVQEYLNSRRKIQVVKNAPPEDIPQLTFTHGRLNVCPVRISKLTEKLSLDLGFRSRRAFPEGEPKGLKEGDCVLVDRKSANWTWQKVEAAKLELFTYQAKVIKVVDGDTLVIALDMGLGMSSEGQRLRLRGIDCPELDTEEGQRAKRFVQARLNPCDFIIVKTFKETVDLHDRYIVDIFYLQGESDPQQAALQGQYLNQELLNEGLAAAYE